MKKTLIAALMACVLLTPLIASGCTSQKEAPVSGEFAIYLTRDDIPVAKMPILSHVEIADTPVISINDIVSYTKDTHEIKLTPEAFERVNSMKIPTSGKVFVVCVDKNPIYWGAFWVGWSSQSFDGVTILFPSFSQQENTIQIERGYPSQSFAQGEDPRSNAEIMKSLKAAGKLK
jgi:hypothetical protein